MTRLILLALVGFGLSLLAFSHSEPAGAARAGTDAINFMASTRGIDHDGDGKLEWCWTQYFHGTYGDALDEVAQRAATNCSSLSTEKVDLMTYGWTSTSTCTTSAPCDSLRVSGIDGEYADGCDYIEARLYDYSSGHAKGMQRMVHARDPYTGWSGRIKVAYNASYRTWYEIGTVVYDGNCGGGWTGYHVHHDFQKPTGANCWASHNTALGSHSSNWEKQNIAHWVHYLMHQFGLPCS